LIIIKKTVNYPTKKKIKSVRFILFCHNLYQTIVAEAAQRQTKYLLRADEYIILLYTRYEYKITNKLGYFVYDLHKSR